VTNRSFDPDDALPAPESPDAGDPVEAVFNKRNPSRTDRHFYLKRLFFCWAWEAGYRDWTSGVRALARALRGLERNGLIARRPIGRWASRRITGSSRLMTAMRR
jgi:hypothetical protein